MKSGKYIESFPSESNPIFRERRAFDCSCCKQFIRAFGNVVTINQENKIASIWDFEIIDETYQPMLNVMKAYVESHSVTNAFIPEMSIYGTKQNKELLKNGQVHTWNHFHVELPKRFVVSRTSDIPEKMNEIKTGMGVFKRSLEEISKEAIETILDLISSNSLYKGAEWKEVLNQFLTLHQDYSKLPEEQKENYCWRKYPEISAGIGRIKNHSIGTLLTNLTEGEDLERAVRKYEAIVAPMNYKRPKAIFSKKMVEQAQQKIEDLGLTDSLGRRFAELDDITINNILFANKNEMQQMAEKDVFASLKEEVPTKPQKFDKTEEVPVTNFIEEVLPRVESLEVFLENKHSSNMLSLIAPQNKEAPSLFKWSNPFSWAYSGNITDSMKERVKAAGGNVTGVLRFSIQWNEEGDNNNDFDAHCSEPNGNHIWFENKGRRHPSTGMLDVDIIDPSHDIRGKDKTAVENITWTTLNRMSEGVYKFYVDTYSYRGGRNGFRAEIEFDGQIFSFDHNKDTRSKEKIVVAEIHYSKKEGFKVVSSLPSTASSKTLWNLKTQQFQPVSVLMFSPNYWDDQSGIGNQHLFFMLRDCMNDSTPNGFFNEFLREDFMPHKKVFEALGNKMKVSESNNQLSGVGFSLTQRNSIVCKLGGRIDRVLKVTF